MEEISAKHILNYCGSGDGWFGLDFIMNLYSGCCHGCIYCDSRSDCYNIKDFDKVRIKKNALQILEAELRKKRTKGRVIGTGSACDHYNPFEKDLKITGGGLELIDRFRFGIVIITKSNLVTRDIDILKSISKHSPAAVSFSVTTADEKLCRIIEPLSPPSSTRFKAMKEIADAGIITGVLITPLLPFINDTEENLISILEAAALSGAKYAFSYGFGVTLRQNQRDYFYDALDKNFPGLKRKYMDAFGNSYFCKSPNANTLWAAFTAKCKQLNLKYEMKDIIALIKKEKGEQLSFI